MPAAPAESPDIGRSFVLGLLHVGRLRFAAELRTRARRDHLPVVRVIVLFRLPAASVRAGRAVVLARLRDAVTLLAPRGWRAHLRGGLCGAERDQARKR